MRFSVSISVSNCALNCDPNVRTAASGGMSAATKGSVLACNTSAMFASSASRFFSTKPSIVYSTGRCCVVGRMDSTAGKTQAHVHKGMRRHYVAANVSLSLCQLTRESASVV